MISERRKQWLEARVKSLKIFLGVMFSSKLVIVGLSIFLVYIIFAIFSPVITPYDPIEQEIDDQFMPPGEKHLLGADRFGRDVLSRLIDGSRITLVVGMMSVVVSLALGLPLGAVAGFYGRYVEEVIMRIMDVLMAFPFMLFAVAIVAFMGPSVPNLILAIGIIYTPIMARVTRASILTVREEDFVMFCRASGDKNSSILFTQVLPNALAPITVQATMLLAFAVLTEAALSFLGLGTPPPDPSWGRMLSDNRTFLYSAPWVTISAGIIIILLVLAINFVGDGLRDALDPRLRHIVEKVQK